MSSSNKNKDATMKLSPGKRQKNFLEKNITKEALLLAVSIGDTQEKKSSTKVQKHHAIQPNQPREERKVASGSKAKLKKVKASLVAQRAQVKREKARLRKLDQRKASPVAKSKGLQDPNLDNTTRKRVSFA